MFKGQLEPGDLAVFMGTSPWLSQFHRQRCVVTVVDSHTTQVRFPDGWVLCAYPGELEPWMTNQPHPVTWADIRTPRYEAMEDEGSLA